MITKIPHTLVLIFMIILFMAILTWLIPGGEFNRIELNNRLVIDPDSFHSVEQVPQGLFDVLQAPIKGFISGGQIIAFILIVGGAFTIIKRSGAIDALIHKILFLQNRHKWMRQLIIPLFMLLFSFFGSLFGMSEEVIPFVLIFVPLAISLGYDSIVGAAIPFIGAGVGFAAAFVNPFTLGVAQEIAQLPPLSGMGFRVLSWFMLTLFSIIFLMVYGERIRKNPTKSLVHDSDRKMRMEYTERNANAGLEKLDSRHLISLLIFASTIISLIVGVLKFQWYINEIAALFLGAGILIGLVAKIKVNQLAVDFIEGAKEFMTVAFIIASARAILVIAEDGKIIDTILYSLSQLLHGMHPVFASEMMLLVQSTINVFIPSGSGQAALVMPIMTPLSDLLNVTRQTAVLAFQMGDGLTNLMIPTSGVTMGVLGLAKIPFEKWLRWILPLMAILFLTSMVLLAISVQISWGPF